MLNINSKLLIIYNKILLPILPIPLKDPYIKQPITLKDQMNHKIKRNIKSRQRDKIHFRNNFKLTETKSKK